MSKNSQMTKGQWAVYRERCRIASRFQPKEMDEHTVADLLPSLMKKIGLEEPHWLETLTSEWINIVGSGVGAHTRPGRIVGKTLYVFVDSSVWLNELKRYGQKQMLHNLQAKFGANRIRNLVIQIAPD